MELQAFAQEEFGHARLANAAQVKRLVRMAARCAERPHGRVTDVFQTSAEREGAYRFLENETAEVGPILEASAIAGLRRAQGERFVFVPVDGSSLSLPDPDGERGLGSVGARRFKGTGIEVMNALIVTPDGTPVGLGAQQWWVRGERPRTRKEQRTIDEKETRHWLRAIEHVVRAAERVENAPELWFQLDRGGDFREMLEWASAQPHRVTIRASHDRRVDSDEGHLWSTLEARKPLGAFTLNVPAGNKRKARSAKIVLRACETTLVLKHRWLNNRWSVRMFAVFAREEGTAPEGESPIEWMLHTNREVTTLEDARLVVRGYAMRWRIEEFHKTWKSVCQIEKTQLRSAEAIQKMASVMAAVAVRIERLKYLSRNEPERPASSEFTTDELDALQLLTNKKLKDGHASNLGDAVYLLALVGSYTGFKSSGGPPGSKVLGRGMIELLKAVEIIEKFRKSIDQR